MTDEKLQGVMPDVQNNKDSSTDFISALSDEFERDSRRYNRAFSEESEVGAL